MARIIHEKKDYSYLTPPFLFFGIMASVIGASLLASLLGGETIPPVYKFVISAVTIVVGFLAIVVAMILNRK